MTADRNILVWAAVGIMVLSGCGRDSSPPGGPAGGNVVVAPGLQGQADPTQRADAATIAMLAQTLPDAAGIPQPIAQWKGKILVLNFWATWCPPCREEMPAFSRLHEKYSANGVQFVGISIDSPAKVRQFSEETPVAYPLLISTLDIMQTLADFGNIAQGLPFTVIVGRDGNLYSTKLGRYDEASLEKRLQELLAKSAK